MASAYCIHSTFWASSLHFERSIAIRTRLLAIYYCMASRIRGIFCWSRSKDNEMDEFVLSQQFMPDSKEHEEQLGFIEDNIQRLRKEM